MQLQLCSEPADGFDSLRSTTGPSLTDRSSWLPTSVAWSFLSSDDTFGSRDINVDIDQHVSPVSNLRCSWL